MLVLSAIKNVKEDIKENLLDKFGEDAEFKFCHGIDEAKDFLPEAEVFITYGEDLDDAFVKSAKKLKWIMVLSAGMDMMPFEQIDKQGILVTNSRGIHAGPMAEYAISMLLQVARQTKALIEHEEKHLWDRRVKMTEISGSTLVVVGTGAIGQEVARLAKAFKIKTIGLSKTGKMKPHFDETFPVDQLYDILPRADRVVAVLPSTPETEYLLKAEAFEQMLDDAVFLNMGRGDLVATEVILEAVRSGQIAHAVLDVFEQEPLPETSPLWDEPSITVTPHLSGISPQYMYRGFELFEKNMAVYLSGKEDFINKIDTKRGY
ncbi:D-2-hydroxyacid dehydrogenase [Thalassobacillus hwangdonensis]|uniref:D-2-hydroxyacid dehydrogenase n=1 Tax=Thalassobacillus hwangdonensis TaxID=546108 RepID=A0ABW3L778_9BACI